MTDLSQRIRLPTLGAVLLAAGRAARRFPLVLLSAALAATAGILLVNAPDDEAPFVRLLATATLGLPLFLALTLTGERRFAAGDAARRWGLQGAGIAVLALFWALWPHWPEPVRVARYVQASVAFHLLAAFLPFAGYDEPNGFWQYNKALFLRFLMAGIYAAVLYGGLALALAALDKLFGVDVPNEAYGRLWMVMAFVVTTWLFLGGVPDDFAALERRSDVPAGLRIFTQYVLVPIIAVYLVMLTAYLGKVLIGRQWPSGWIGYLVSSVATVGILAWLLVRPLEGMTEYRWVRTYTRGFYVALLPAIVMLWLAIGKRVAQYGVTERRYFMIVLSLWWAGIAVYYTLGRSRSIKVIPATLCLLALLTFAGPWGAYRVSLASQRHRLDGLVARYGLRVVTTTATVRDVPFADRKEIAATVRYLVERHDRQGVAARFGGTASLASSAVETRVRAIMASIGVAYVSPWDREESKESYYFRASWTTAPTPIDGYQYAIHLGHFELRDTLRVDATTTVWFVKARNGFRVDRGGAPALEIPLQPLIERATAYRRARGRYDEVPIGLLRTETNGPSGAALVYLTMLSATRGDSGWAITTLDGELFLRLN
jgi:uncharacterized protein DUF4153